MDAQNLFEKFKLNPIKLGGELIATSAEDFEKQYRLFFSKNEAKIVQSVIYVSYIDKPIKRLKGESNILYIGQTIQGLAKRNLYYAKKESEGGNWQRYEFIFSQCLAIKILFAEVNDPKSLEKEFLKAYFTEHLEIPPMNRMSI